MDAFHEVFSLIWFVAIVFLSFVSTVLQFILWSPTPPQDKITCELFMAICIASGTDYNKNMKNIGPAKVIPAIRKYGSIKKWQEDQPNLPFHILKWKRCLEIFRPYSKEYLERCNITAMAFNAPELDNLFKEAEASYDARYVLACLEGRVEHRFIRKSLLDE